MGNSGSGQFGNVDVSIASPNTPMQTPESEYARRLNERQQQITGIRVLHQRLWMYLVAAILASAIVGYLALSSHMSPLWMLLPLTIAASIIRSLTKNARAHSHKHRILSFYEFGIARLHHRWQGCGSSGEEFQPHHHAYASDLDLFGKGSLFELLCTARTGIGRTMLAQWLLNPAECAEVANRQPAIAELRDMLDLREYWASVGGDALDQVSSSAVSDWATAPRIVFPLYLRVFAITLPVCLITLSILAHIGLLGQHWPWAISVPIGLEAVLAAVFLKKTRLTAANLGLPSFELSLLVPLVARLETEPFQCPLLRSLQSRLTARLSRPFERIRILRLLVWLLDLRRFEYFALLVSPVLWGTNFAILIERWRQQNQEGLATWLESIGQFEALLCLARYSYENPDHTFATVKSQSLPLFQAEALGHPLLDRKTCVRCDLSLDGQGTQVIMVSGSNMSGKSTLLRSVGVNSVLALAGAPVRAARLVISPLQIGCSIAIQDSLSQAQSRFQAEVERLKWVLALSRTNNSLFLLDEVLGGTNSNDRFLGARAVIEQLAGNGAVGLVTTHDLALTEVVLALDGRGINVHFEEHYENGEMRFDYRMRSGVLTRTNGLNVMAALGILPLSKTGETNITTPNPASTLN